MYACFTTFQPPCTITCILKECPFHISTTLLIAYHFIHKIQQPWEKQVESKVVLLE